MEDDLGERADADRTEEEISADILDRQKYRDLGPLASWTVSTAKPGFDIDRVQDDSLETYWQSDGPQPHFINIHFPRKVSLKYVSIYLNFQLDESYTPSSIRIMSGTGYHTLAEVHRAEFNEPTGWKHIDLTLALGPYKVGHARELEERRLGTKLFDTRLLQVQIVSNHQNGKDTHVRAIKIHTPRAIHETYGPPETEMDLYTIPQILR